MLYFLVYIFVIIFIHLTYGVTAIIIVMFQRFSKISYLIYCNYQNEVLIRIHKTVKIHQDVTKDSLYKANFNK